MDEVNKFLEKQMDEDDNRYLFQDDEKQVKRIQEQQKREQDKLNKE